MLTVSLPRSSYLLNEMRRQYAAAYLNGGSAIDLAGRQSAYWRVTSESIGAILGIQDAEEITERKFQCLSAGLNAAGKKLVQNALRSNRVPFVDFTFSAPKAVSLLRTLALVDRI